MRLSEEVDFAASQIMELKEQNRLERERVIELESVESYNLFPQYGIYSIKKLHPIIVGYQI